VDALHWWGTTGGRATLVGYDGWTRYTEWCFAALNHNSAFFSHFSVIDRIFFYNWPKKI